MKKRIASLLLLALLLCTVSCSGGRQADPPPEAEQYPVAFLEASPAAGATPADGGVSLSLPAQAQLSASFRISEGVPNALCVIRATVDASALSQADGQTPTVLLQATSSCDVNARVIHTEGSPTAKGQYTVQRLLLLDGNGQADFSLSFGRDGQAVRGEVRVGNMSCTPVEQDADYAVYTQDGSAVRFIFLAQDVTTYGITPAVVREMLHRMTDLDTALRGLTGHDKPWGTGSDFVFTENIPYTALAGQPIYVNRAELSYLIPAMTAECAEPNRPLSQRDATALLSHELSHTYDIATLPNEQAAYCFDKELFATLKSVYALEASGFTLATDFLSSSPALSSGMYSHEVLLSRLLAGIRQAENGWNAVKAALQALYSNEPLDSPLEAYFAFTDALRAAGGGTVLDTFTPQELEFLENYFTIISQ